MSFLSTFGRSEEHTSELQSLRHLVCRLLLEKKNNDAPKPVASAAGVYVRFVGRDVRTSAHGRTGCLLLVPAKTRRTRTTILFFFFKNSGGKRELPLFPAGPFWQ